MLEDESVARSEVGCRKKDMDGQDGRWRLRVGGLRLGHEGEPERWTGRTGRTGGNIYGTVVVIMATIQVADDRELQSCEGKAKTHYFLRSVSEIVGNPANNFFLFCKESERTMSSPPTTLRLRRKNDKSNRRP